MRRVERVGREPGNDVLCMGRCLTGYVSNTQHESEAERVTIDTLERIISKLRANSIETPTRPLIRGVSKLL